MLWSESSGSALPIPGVHLPKIFRHDDDTGGGSSSERNLNTSFRRARRGSGMRRGSLPVGGNLGGSFRNKSPGGSFRGKNGVNLGSHSQLVWRNVDELANDPDQVRDLIHKYMFISYALFSLYQNAHIMCSSLYSHYIIYSRMTNVFRH